MLKRHCMIRNVGPFALDYSRKRFRVYWQANRARYWNKWASRKARYTLQEDMTVQGTDRPPHDVYFHRLRLKYTRLTRYGRLASTNDAESNCVKGKLITCFCRHPLTLLYNAQLVRIHFENVADGKDYNLQGAVEQKFWTEPSSGWRILHAEQKNLSPQC